MIFIESKQKQINKNPFHTEVLGYKMNQNSKSELDPSQSSYSERTGGLALGDAFGCSKALGFQLCHLTPSPFVPVKSVHVISVTAHQQLHCSPV